MMRALRRRLMLAACALPVLLAGCGFQLQGRANLSPVLARVPWRRIPRPIYPLDPDTTWSPG